MRFLYVLIFVLLGLQGNYTFAEQSKLPPCPGEYKISKSLFGDGPDERWNNCFGKSTYANQTYLGEWKDGLPHGQGLLKYPDNKYILGVFNKQNPEGYAITFEESGAILWSGYIENRKSIRKAEVDYRKFDQRLTQILVDKSWREYFLAVQNEKIDGYFDCVKKGLNYYKIFVNNPEYPNLPPDSKDTLNIQKKCKNFIDNNESITQKIDALSSECAKDKKNRNQCYAGFIYEDSISQEYIELPIDDIYEAAFSEKNWRHVTQFEALLSAIEFDLKKRQINELKEAERKEAERKEAERKEAERKEAERKEAERKEAERKDTERKFAERKENERREAERKEIERKEAEQRQIENEVNASGKNSSPHQGKNLFSCSGSFAGESLVEMYSLSLIKLWSQNKKIDFSEVYLESNKRLLPFQGRCDFSGEGRYIVFPIRPKGQRIVVTKIGVEEFVLYRTQGSLGVGFVAQIEKPVAEESKQTKSKETERRENERKEVQSNSEKNKKSDQKTGESKTDDKIIFQNLTKQFEKFGITAYKPQGSVCGKGTELDSLYRENIAKRYKSPLSLVSLIRTQESSGGCEAVVDTVHGPIQCIVGSVLTKKGNNKWLLTYFHEWPSGEITTFEYHCRPHPDAFDRR